MNAHSDGWYPLAQPDITVRVIAAGIPTRGQLPPEGGVPWMPAGMVIEEPDSGHVHSVAMVLPVREAGRLIASMLEWASRNGMEYALQSAVDQGRAWARQAPGG